MTLQDDYYQFGFLKDTWNTVTSIPKVMGGVSAVKDALKTGDFTKLSDWASKNFKGNGENPGLIGKAVDWVKNNKGLAAAAATGLGSLFLNQMNKGGKQQGSTTYMMPGMGGGMMPMPMMNPYMGMMNPYMGMMPGMGGGMMMVRNNPSQSGFMSNLAQAALTGGGVYALSKFFQGNQQNDEQKKEEEQTDEQYAQSKLNELMKNNPEYAPKIQEEYNTTSKTLGVRNAVDTLASKYKGGYYEKKEEATPESAADKIRSTFGQKRSWWDVYGKIKDQNAKTRYDQAISGMTEDQRNAFQNHIVKNMEQGNNWRDAINANVKRINQQGGQRVVRPKDPNQNQTTPTANQQTTTTNMSESMSMDDIQGRFLSVYFSVNI